MILGTDNALQFIEKINTAFSASGTDVRLDSSLNANDVITSLNSVFSLYTGYTEITDEMNSVAFLNAVNSNLLLMGYTNNTFKFLHISDVHNYAESITRCKTLMDADDSLMFTFLTGDYTGYDGSTANVVTPLQSLGDKALMLNGNHDVWDGFSQNQTNATTFLKSIVTNQNVTWGDSQGVASYWYRDFQLSITSKLRIISVDGYDYRVGSIGSRYDTLYAQSQVDWIIDRLTELNPTDYFIIATHEPPVNSTVSDQTPYTYNVQGKMDDDIVAKRRSNKFCSSRLWVWDTSLSNGNLLPIIVDAYTNSRSINTSVLNTNTVTGATVSTINIVDDFSGYTPATFLFYLGGHLHGDYVEYHPTFQDQLILLVDCGSNTTLGSSSDIGSRSSDTSTGTRTDGILINEVMIDFSNERTRIRRIGQNSALSYNGFSAVTRDVIMVPFTKQQ